MSERTNMSSKQLIPVDYCDFGRCSRNCWPRCTSTMDRWDGAPTLLWREVWRLKWRQKPTQVDMFGEAA